MTRHCPWVKVVCSLFEHFSSSLHWIVNNKLGIEGCVHVHILDDFLLVGPPCLSLCTGQVELFLRFMQQIGVPLKQEKTVYPTTMLTFLGLELDTNDMEIRLPMEKLQKIREILSLYKQRKKIT